MTASPSPSPSPTPSSSRPASSPANTVFDSSSRATFLPLSLPPISQIESHYLPSAYTRGPSRSPSVPPPPGSPGQRRPHHGRERSDESTAAATPSDNTPMANPSTEETKQADSPESSQQEPHKLLKKKRTRTLTTPQQSAVLHALLAQSRFPTTAMREEVGRSIGLSARKVQVWFQNQRQKARKPRFQNPESAPFIDLHQHAHFGSYAGIEAGPVAGPSRVSPPSNQAVLQGGRPAGTPPELPSPPRGMPIPMASSRQSLSDIAVSSRYHEISPQYSGSVSGAVSPVSPSSGGSFFAHASHYPSTASYSHEYGRRSTSMPFPGSSSGHGEPPIQLPPLRFDHPNLQSSSQRPLRTSTSIPSLAGLEISPTSSSSRGVLPPPMTLQPAPQWDWDRFLPPSLTGMSTDAPPLRMPDSSTQCPEDRGTQSWPLSSEHSRSHIGERYDPIRGADTRPGSGDGRHLTSRETSRPGQEEMYRRVVAHPTDEPPEKLARK